VINSHLIKIPTYSDSRGKLGVLEDIIDLKINRIFFIYNFKKKRGGHSHKKNKQVLICLKGKVKINIFKDKIKESFELKSQKVGLYLHPQDWHEILPISKNPILISICSKKFDKKDYIYEK
jgi:dTDP-4-dehydrorhamnose 3,5-epimerase-like enzyme